MAKSSGGGFDRGKVKSGGYQPGLRQSGGGGPRTTDGSGPKDREVMDKSDYGQKGMGVNAFKSTESQKGGQIGGVRDNDAGPTRELKRNAPNVGVYQSGNNNRGGSATKNYDTTQDSDLEIRWDGLDELRAKQDRVGRRGSED